ncbi:MAG: response regulator [Gemmatimonadales bacterium]
MSADIPRSIPTILVVDDEPTVRRSVYRILAQWGFRVMEAETAAEAMTVLSSARDRPQLVILDVILPGTDGVTLARQIWEQWPQQRVLYMSAFPAEVLYTHGLRDLTVGFVEKPFTGEELLRKVETALTQPISGARASDSEIPTPSGP